MKKISILSILIILFPIVVFAHPGRTDSSGCHTCRTNCAKWGLSTGEYHCHRAKASAPQPKEPIKSHYSESGGYTTPAPEYKVPKKVTETIATSTKNIKIENTTPKNTENWFIRFLKSLF